jgi:uncharacterized delta-60 repeat protein
LQLTSTGRLDPSFGAGGKTTADFGFDECAPALVLQRDGNIVVAGSRYNQVGAGGASDFAIARINPNGLYDTSFGGGGKAVIDFGCSDGASAVVLQRDGKIVVVGYTTAGSRASEDFAMLGRGLAASHSTTAGNPGSQTAPRQRKVGPSPAPSPAPSLPAPNGPNIVVTRGRSPRQRKSTTHRPEVAGGHTPAQRQSR